MKLKDIFALASAAQIGGAAVGVVLCGLNPLIGMLLIFSGLVTLGAAASVGPKHYYAGGRSPFHPGEYGI